MTVEWLMFALVFVAGLWIGHAFGRWHGRYLIQRGIEAGRYTLAVSRSEKRRQRRIARARSRMNARRSR